MTTFRCDGDRCFYVDGSSRIALGIVFLGMAAAIASLAWKNIDLPALLLIGGCIFFWLYYATLVVVVSANSVEVRRFWRPVWYAARDQAQAKVGLGGEARTHTALILTAPGQRNLELLRTLFGKAALAEIAELLKCEDEIPETIF